MLSRYINPDNKESARSLNVFCVRIVFLLYAEDSGLFVKSQFHDYMKPRENMARDALQKLFHVLTSADPYVNGGLFADKDIELPQLDGDPLCIIIQDMS